MADKKTIKQVEKQYKVLRIYEGGAEPSDDWHKINNPYGPNDIAKIKDPAGDTDRDEITSIPSPFARIHLFETAYRIIANKATENPEEIDGSTIYHKLISDSLDVAEIFFKYDLFQVKHNLGIIKWNKKKDLEALKAPNADPKLQLLGETLDLYLRQDGALSNFDRLENLYFVTMNHRIIGGTSPSTLFFCSGNDLSFANLVQGNDTFFDDDYYPLYKRDPILQKYLYALFKVYPTLTQDMSLFYKYLLANLKALEKFKPDIADSIKELQAKLDYTEDQFKQEFQKWDNTQNVEIFPGIEHLKKSKEVVDVGDFKIDSSKYKGLAPVVLQNGYSRALNYFGGKWNPDIVVPYYDPEEKLEDRYVPGQDVNYPYLTVSDFLEPVLIEVPYAVNSMYFFDGNPEGFFKGDKMTQEPPENMYLIPIKKLFFNFFDIYDLKGSTSDKKPIVRMVKIGLDAVRVELLIPIIAKGEYIKFERIYKNTNTYDEYKNEGVIRKCKFSLGFLPFINPETQVNQRVGLVDADVIYGDDKTSEYKINFLEVADSGCVNKDTKQTTIRSDEAKNHGHNATSKYFILNQSYDMIEVSKPNGIKGLIIPNFHKLTTGGKQFTFAIDFGTTNSHIEYSVDGGNPQPFDISKDSIDRQLITLFDDFWILDDPQLQSLLTRELIPYHIGEGSSYEFPLRTATSEISNLNHFRATFPLGDINIPYHYEKSTTLINEEVSTDLKWTNLKDPTKGQINTNRVEAFIETLLILIRNKVLLNGGSLTNTRIIWFFPSSMSTNQVNQYRKIWREKFKAHINKDSEPQDFSESEVPFYNHPPHLVKSQRYPVVNIDIGGGTTDIVMFQKDHPKLLTSIKYAGNAVFGDGYRKDISAENGFVLKFSSIVEHFLENNKNELQNLRAVYEQLSKPGKSKSSDLMAFFFSLENNHELESKNLTFKFSDKVASDEHFNIVFIVFYGSIIYHIAKLLKRLKIEMPRNISLSGNGSKIINLLDSSPGLKGIERLTKLIFEKVYEKTYHGEGLSIVQGDKPKEATCKGGIIKLNQNKLSDDFDRIVLLGDEADTIINNKAHNYEHSFLKYQQVTTEHKASTIKEVNKFIDILFDLHHSFDFEDNFGIAPEGLRKYKSELKSDIEDSLERGLSERKELSDPDKNVEETLFFYPLIASLYELTIAIANEK